MAAHLDYFIKLNRLSTGRWVFTLRQIRDAAAGLGDTSLLSQVEEAMTQARQAYELDGQWAVQKRSVTGSSMPELDNRVDRTLTGLRDGALAQASGASPDDEIVQRVERFLAAVFPSGLFAVTSLPFVEEAVAVEDIVRKLQNELAPMVAELGLTRQAARLAALSAPYREALAAPGIPLRFNTVEEARAVAHAKLLQIVAVVLGRYNQDTPEHEAAREALLGPVMVQQEAVRAYVRLRRAVRDVDPETGELDDTLPDTDLPEAEAGAEADAGADAEQLA